MAGFNKNLWDVKEVSRDGKLFLEIKPTKLMLTWLKTKVIFRYIFNGFKIKND